MDEVEAIVSRLERIERLRNEGAQASDLLRELRELLTEAEAWAEVEGGDAGERAASRLREALTDSLAAG
jgi:hypothetical protein